MMKLVIAIVQDEDSSRLVNKLMKEGFGVTKSKVKSRLFRTREKLHAYLVWEEYIYE